MIRIKRIRNTFSLLCYLILGILCFVLFDLVHHPVLCPCNTTSKDQPFKSHRPSRWRQKGLKGEHHHLARLQFTIASSSSGRYLNHLDMIQRLSVNDRVILSTTLALKYTWPGSRTPSYAVGACPSL